MQITFHHTPLLFQDTIELLYLHANRLPIPEITPKNKPYTIPTADLVRIREAVCQDLSPEDKILQYFFRQYILPDDSCTCLARILAHSFADMSCTTAQQGLEAICRQLKAMERKKLVFDNLSSFTVDSLPGHGETDAGISKLKAPAELRHKLLAIYRDPDGHLQRLSDLTAPIMERLSQALHPCVSQAAMTMQAWEDKARASSPELFFQECLHIEGTLEVQRIEAGMLFFTPQWIIFGLEDDASILKMFIGSGVGLPWKDDDSDLQGWEYRALHLLSSPDRLRMLRAMGEKPMSSREIAKELALHLGSVTRDINSMYEAYLLNVIHQGSRRRYSLNTQAIHTLAHHLLSMCEEEK